MALPKAHHIETLSGFNSLKFSYDSTNTHYFTGGTDTIVEGTPDILYTDIAYIKPLSAIYTHAKIYPCPVLEYDNVPTDGSSKLVTSAGIKAAIDAVAQSAAQGLKLVDLAIYQGQQGEIVKHNGATSGNLVNGYDYKYTVTSVPLRTITTDESISNFVSEGSMDWSSIQQPFYRYDYISEHDGEYYYYFTFFHDDESIDDTDCIMLEDFADKDNPQVTVGMWCYLVSYDEQSKMHCTPEQIVSLSGNKFTTENGHVYDVTDYDYNDFCSKYVNENGDELFRIGDANVFYLKDHIADIASYDTTDYDPSITITIYTTTSSWVQTDAQPPAVYTAGTGLKLSNNQFSLNAPRVAKSCNSLPGKNTAIIEEYSSGDNYDLPSNALYHIITMQGNDTTSATQLALCVNNDAGVYYRRMTSSIWQPWLCLNPTMDSTPTAGNTSNVVSSAGVKTYVDNAVSAKQVLLSEADYTALQTKDPNVIYYTY